MTTRLVEATIEILNRPVKSQCMETINKQISYWFSQWEKCDDKELKKIYWNLWSNFNALAENEKFKYHSMKNILTIIACCLALSSCVSVKTVRESNDLNVLYNVTPVVRNGHSYILYEYGTKGKPGYSFDIEHSDTCSMCLDMFD